MPEGPLNPRQMGKYVELAQVGLEMAVPIGVGAFLDNYFGWSPWGVVVGAILGLVTGLYHLVAIANRGEGPAPRPPEDKVQ